MNPFAAKKPKLKPIVIRRPVAISSNPLGLAQKKKVEKTFESVSLKIPKKKKIPIIQSNILYLTTFYYRYHNSEHIERQRKFLINLPSDRNPEDFIPKILESFQNDAQFNDPNDPYNPKWIVHVMEPDSFSFEFEPASDQTEEADLELHANNVLGYCITEPYIANGECVPIGLVTAFRKFKGHKLITIQEIEKQMKEIGINKKGKSSNDIFKWIEAYHPDVNCYETDANFKEVRHYIRENNHHSISFNNSNMHFYVLKDEYKRNVNIEQLTRFKLSKDVKFVKNHRPDFTTEEDWEEEKNLIDDLINGKIDQDVCTDIELETLLTKMEENAKLKTLSIRLDGCQLMAFKQPNNARTVQYYPDYLTVKKYFDIAYESLKDERLIFTNQNIPSLSILLHEIFGKYKLRKSCNNHLDNSWYETDDNSSCTSPLYYTLYDPLTIKKKDLTFVDIKKCHTNALKNMKYEYPCFSLADHVQPYDGRDIVCGEYKLKGSRRIGKIYIKENQVIPWNAMKVFLDRRYLTKDDIMEMRLASYRIDNKYFVPFVEGCMKLYPQKYKDVINFLPGVFNVRYQKNHYGFKSDNLKCIIAHYRKLGKNVTNSIVPTENGNSYYFSYVDEFLKNEDYSPIYRQIIAEEWIGVLDLIELNPDAEVIGVKTDCVIFRNHTKTQLDYDLIDKGKYLIEETKELRAYKPFREIENKPHKFRNSSWQIVSSPLNHKGIFITGLPGTGKTETTHEIANEFSLRVTSTKKACRAADVNKRPNISSMKTLSKVFYNNDDIPGYVTNLIVDEVLNVSEYFMRKIYFAWLKNPKLTCAFAGDHQCQQVYDKHFDWTKSPIFMEMCDYKMYECPYIEGKSRFPSNLYQMVKTLRETGKMGKLPLNKPTNQFGISIYRQACFEFSVDALNAKRLEEIGGYGPGVKLISMTNKQMIIHSEIYTIKAIKLDKKVELVEVEGFYSLSDFNLAHVMTKIQMQGSSFDEPYNIYNSKLMTRESLAVAISRGRKMEYVHIDENDLDYVWPHDEIKESVLIANDYEAYHKEYEPIVDKIVVKSHISNKPVDESILELKGIKRSGKVYRYRKNGMNKTFRSIENALEWAKTL